MVGTVDYIAPEVFEKEGYTETVDFWSLGTILFEMLLGYPPFCGKTPSVTLNNVLHFEKNFKIPSDSQLSKEAIDLMRKLITRADRRLGRNGVQEIKDHPFFRGINWTEIRKRPAPIIPKLSNEEDTRNFEKFEMNSAWNPVFYQNNSAQRNEGILFIGYTYKKPESLDAKKEIEEIFERLRKKKETDGKRNFSEERLQPMFVEPTPVSKIGSISRLGILEQKPAYNFLKKPHGVELTGKNNKPKLNEQYIKNYTLIQDESGFKVLKTESKKLSGNPGSNVVSSKLLERNKPLGRELDVTPKLFQKGLKGTLLPNSKMAGPTSTQTFSAIKKSVVGTGELVSRLKSSSGVSKFGSGLGGVKPTFSKTSLLPLESLKAKLGKPVEKGVVKLGANFIKLGNFSGVKK